MDDIRDLVGIVHVNLAGRVIEIPGQICRFYICGPKAMQESLVAGLREWGVDDHSIHFEVFSAPEARAAQSVEEAQITFEGNGKTAIWRRDQGLSLLEFAEEQGLEPANSCRMGSCQSCICTVKEGSVAHTIDVHDLPSNQALICSAVPTSKTVVLDL